MVTSCCVGRRRTRLGLHPWPGSSVCQPSSTFLSACSCSGTPVAHGPWCPWAFPACVLPYYPGLPNVSAPSSLCPRFGHLHACGCFRRGLSEGHARACWGPGTRCCRWGVHSQPWRPDVRDHVGSSEASPGGVQTADSSPCPRTAVPLCGPVSGSPPLRRTRADGVSAPLVASFFSSSLKALRPHRAHRRPWGPGLYIRGSSRADGDGDAQPPLARERDVLGAVSSGATASFHPRGDPSSPSCRLHSRARDNR